MGIMLARMHDAGIVHGDLTTSNFMLRKTEGEEPSLVCLCLCVCVCLNVERVHVCV